MLSLILDFLTQTLVPLIISVGAVILLFGGTVLVHELGHFLTAKWFGLRIDAFSIGMGPALWQKEVNGVVYKISLLPIGGYVALPQMDITGSAFENEDAANGTLTEVAPWKRIIIAVAGPFMNVVAAFVLAIIVWQVGKPPDSGPGPALVGSVAENSAAYEAGLREGDLIKKVNEDKIKFWADFQIASMLNRKIDLVVTRGEQVLYFDDLPTAPNPLGFLELEGVEPIEPGLVFLGVHKVVEDSAADAAGMQVGDRLLQVNGKEVTGTQMFIDEVTASEGSPVDVVVRSEGETNEKTLTMSPRWNKELKRWLIGIEFMGEFEKVHPSPLSQIEYFQGSIFRTLKAFTRKQEIGLAAKGVGGPVMILSGMHTQVKYDPMQALWFTALININLAIINLLPLIILDGGHIMVALFEMITGRKVHRGLITGMANVMVVFLLLMMVLLSFKDVFLLRDIERIMDADGEEVPAEATATPLPASTEDISAEAPAEPPAP